MFNRNFLNNEIGYFTDTISEPLLLIDFIEKLDNESENIIISKWDSLNNNLFYRKTIFAENQEVNNPRVLYVYNSLYSGMKFCLDLYGEMKQIPERLNMYKKINLDKNLNKTEVNENFSMNNLNVGYIILSFLNDDYEGGELVFPESNVSIKPEKGSTIIFPNHQNIKFQFNDIVSGHRYMTSNCILN
jgi:hypothetical protein